MAWRLNKFMVIYGGMNDFNQTLGDLIVYDLDYDQWVEKVKIISKESPPPISHATSCTVFYDQRDPNASMKSIYNMPKVDWYQVKDFILYEGFYLFGGYLEGAKATNELWILQSDVENLKWLRPTT